MLGSGLLPISAAYYRLRDNGVWGSNIELADIVGSDGSLGGGGNIPEYGQDVQFRWSPPVTDGSGRDRPTLRRALDLLTAAGYLSSFESASTFCATCCGIGSCRR